jgi:hypothetical protein
MIQAGHGLQAAHDAGLVHRDFKPDNMIIGSDGRVRVLDFGLACSGGSEAVDRTMNDPTIPHASATLSTRLTETGTMLGTPAYMSPEQFSSKKAGPASDQFSFCVALYEALYAERPFAGNSIESLALSVGLGRIRESSSSLKIPSGLRTALLQGLAVDPGQRHTSMNAVLEALERVLGSKRRRAMWLLGLVMTLVLGLLGAGLTGLVQEARAQAAKNQRVANEQERTATMERRRAERAIVNQRNALLVSMARELDESPAEAAAFLREVQGPNPRAIRRWTDSALRLGKPVTLAKEDARVWQVVASRIDARTALWRSPFCHSTGTRTELFSEPEYLAAENHARCLELSRLCTQGTYAECHTAVHQAFAEAQ